ncbi:hypothetical protein [Simkania negevensis]|uniref:Uncharacterized protein n=1 Tax=Simkania negevensis (strain ATCC VR-1471 / DSM 27360 / Z) TaxID=331113 RepID=F8L9W1_SIMNZ|nr:hypothetical protein [Simkania negevensis]CCB89667.1 unknown protein [Simkania negevensis Z]
MGLVELASVKVPPFNDFSLPERILDKTDSVASLVKEKGISFCKALDLGLSWVTMMSKMSPNSQETIGLAKQGFKEAGALNTLVSIGNEVPEVHKFLSNTKKKITSWVKGDLETPKIQDLAKKALFGVILPVIKKVDDIFWALANFSLFKNRAVNIFHGFGYTASAAVAVKNIYETGTELKEMCKNPEEQPITPEKWKLGITKIGKLISSLGTTVTGFALLLTSSTKLSFVYLGFSTSSLVCDLTEFMIDKASDPAVKQQKMLEQKLKREKTFQMIT